MKKAALFLFFLVLTGGVFAQNPELLVKKGENGLYLEHKVLRGQSFFAIGRQYNVSVKYLAAYNKLDLNKALWVDQKLRIPLTDTNFTQKGNSGTPVYHKTASNEDLGDISAQYGNVPKEYLAGWNKLSTSVPKEGAPLIIGFLQSRGMTAVTIDMKPVKLEETTVKTNPPVTKVETKETPVKPETKPETKPAEKEVQKPVEQKPVEQKPELKPIEEKTETKPIEEKINEKPVVSDQGYFRSHFDKQTRINPVSKNETVASGVFKTLSGWQDGKYYILVDKLPSGTIVKVVNPTNNKAIYAKVLGEMSGIRQNQGLDIRISNAAASVLEITELEKFIVRIIY